MSRKSSPAVRAPLAEKTRGHELRQVWLNDEEFKKLQIHAILANVSSTGAFVHDLLVKYLADHPIKL